MLKKELLSYAKRISSGQIIASKWLKLAAVRFIKDCKRTDIVWDEDEAERFVLFVENELRYFEAEWRGKPMRLSIFQRFVTLNILCWKRNGKRRFTSAYIQLARKNAKTTLVAILALYHLLIGGTHTPQIQVGANNDEQAKICVNAAGQICKISPLLRDLVNDGSLTLYNYKGKVVSISYEGGLMESLTKNAETKDGFNPSFGIIDEYHEAKDDKLLNVIENGQGARHPYMVCITTAGFRREGPCFSNLRDQSTKLLTGQIEDDSHFAIICELDHEDEVHDPKNWIKANPMIDEIATLRPFIEGRYRKAKNEGGTKWVDFLTKNMDTWTDAPEIWIADSQWQKNFKHELTPEFFHGKDIYGGLDLSISTDLTAFSIIHEDAAGIVHVLPFFWIPEARLTYDKFDYIKARMGGNIFVSEGNVIDHTHVVEHILALGRVCNFKSIGYDNYLFNKTILQVIEANALPFNEVKQQMKSMHPPTDTLMRLVMEEKINHGNHPVLRWNVSQVELVLDHEGAFKPTKKRGEKKIDGVISVINAVSEWMRPDYEIKDVSEIFQ